MWVLTPGLFQGLLSGPRPRSNAGRDLLRRRNVPEKRSERYGQLQISERAFANLYFGVCLSRVLPFYSIVGLQKKRVDVAAVSLVPLASQDGCLSPSEQKQMC